MFIKAYPVILERVERGAAEGVRRAYKYGGDPSHEAITDAVTEAIMIELSEAVDFGDDDGVH